jgi:hypothetical protein
VTFAFFISAPSFRDALLGVAVQVEFESANFETNFSLHHRFNQERVETGRFQAMGQELTNERLC